MKKILSICLAGICHIVAGQTIYEVEPAVETVASHVSGDYLDDPAIWIHPDDPAQSAVIGTCKHPTQGGLYVYNLDGSTNQFLQSGTQNGVDLRYNFPLGETTIDLVVSGDRGSDTLKLFSMNASTRQLEPIGARDLPMALSGDPGYGLCMYRSEHSGKTYCFVGNTGGGVEQWELYDNGSNRVDGTIVRTFDAGGICEGMVADDELGFYYIAEENVGIWKYDAEPDGGTTRVSVATAAVGQPIVPDIEGLSIYYGREGSGYLLVSSQGEDSGTDPFSDTFAVYERGGTNAYVMSFEVVAANGIDAVTRTDGIDVCNVPLNTTFSNGLFATHDTDNGAENTSFKLVPWENITSAPPTNLQTDLSWNPRDVGNPLGDTDGDGLSNQWEDTYFGGTTVAAADGDPDGDGYTNEEEFIAGLNPTLPDAFVISSLNTGPDVVLEWNSLSGRVYSVYWTTNLTAGFPALPLVSNLTDGVYTDQTHTTIHGFYRIDVQSAP
ncbi:phytase [Pontiella sp.]|uniref:phytase n=1 Tax=Pontiella sp. TaxID=2837462 RepID=UPI00356327CA